MKDKLQLLFITDNFPPETNAAASRVYERSEYLYEQKIFTEFVTTFPHKNINTSQMCEFENLNPSVKVYRARTISIQKKSIFLRLLKEMSFMISSFLYGIKKKSSEIDFIMTSSPPFFSSISAYLIARFHKKPLVIEIADIWSDSIEITISQNRALLSFIRFLENFIYQRADLLVLLTEGFKKKLIKRGIEEKKTHVIRNGVNPFNHKPENDSLIDKHLTNLKAKKIIGYIGSFGRAQNLMNIVNTAKILQEKQSNIFFILIGEGEEKDKLLMNSNNLRNILILDGIKKELVINYYKLFDAGLAHLKMDKIFEHTIPSKIFEIMSAELPVILVSPAGEASSILKEENVGMWSCADSPELLAQELEDFFSSNAQYEVFKENAKTSSVKFTRKKQAYLLANILKELHQRYEAARRNP